MKYYVVYNIVGTQGNLEAGPYDHEWVAWVHRADIAGFEYVYNARVVRR